MHSTAQVMHSTAELADSQAHLSWYARFVMPLFGSGACAACCPLHTHMMRPSSCWRSAAKPLQAWCLPRHCTGCLQALPRWLKLTALTQGTASSYAECVCVCWTVADCGWLCVCLCCSPLCPSTLIGCARGHLGVVLVLKRLQVQGNTNIRPYRVSWKQAGLAHMYLILRTATANRTVRLRAGALHTAVLQHCWSTTHAMMREHCDFEGKRRRDYG